MQINFTINDYKQISHWWLGLGNHSNKSSICFTLKTVVVDMVKQEKPVLDRQFLNMDIKIIIIVIKLNKNKRRRRKIACGEDYLDESTSIKAY